MIVRIRFIIKNITLNILYAVYQHLFLFTTQTPGAKRWANQILFWSIK